jgi:nucleoside-diphosphate-sugar epimerase
VLPAIVSAIRERRTVELGNLWPKRDLVFVTDTVKALLAAAAGCAGFDVFNVGTGVGTTVPDVVRTIEAVRGEPLEVREVPSRRRDVDGHLVADPSKLMSATGWSPEYDVEAGLREAVGAGGALSAPRTGRRTACNPTGQRPIGAAIEGARRELPEREATIPGDRAVLRARRRVR